MTPKGAGDITGIISDRNEILQELFLSKENGNILGIWSAKQLGKNLLMCTIESIHDDHLENDKAIVVKEIDSRGLVLKAHLLYLRQIEKVHRFQLR